MFLKKPINAPLLPIILLLVALLMGAAVRGQHPDFPALDPLPRLDSLPDEDVADWARRFAIQTADIREVFYRKAQRATLEREVLAEQLNATLADSTASGEDIRTLALAVREAQSAEKSALQALQKAEKVLASVQKMSEQSPRALRKSLPKAYRQVQALIPPPPERPIAEILENVGARADTLPKAPAETPAEAPSASANAAEAAPPPAPPAPKRPVFKKYDPAADVMLNPPTRPCALTADTRDAFSGERRREVQREELFRYTNPSLRPYLQDREHIVCQAAVSQNGKLYVLNLTFTISDANAKRAFGSLPKNSVALLKFLDGETITLTNLRTDEGRVGDDKITHIFTGQYVLDAAAMKKMQKSLLDKIRIAWATGYEDYEIHQVDLIARQLGCLLKG
ncbi:MAG: hypothetical protein RMJ33_12260 [Saprospiraceae bacterium]|nr:hypothetical protein [Saprospiraceae bacterium]MDW8230601.1 hypothetical protein [Saprospiraceae bacterium]